MQINYHNHSALDHLLELEKCVSDISTDCIHDFKNKLIGVIFYGNCRSMADISVKSWSDYFLNCNVSQEKLLKLDEAIKRLRAHIYTLPVQEEDFFSHRHSLVVRLKGQEIAHFNGQKCTDLHYTGDDDADSCILDAHTPPQHHPSQRYGYQEMLLLPGAKQLLYTLRLGPCIAILMVGSKLDGAVKAALMHEDCLTPKKSVTDMYTHSFAPELKDFKDIKTFLIGGNGGGQYTRDRFTTHRSEISELYAQHSTLITFPLSTDNLESPDDQFQWDESHVFLAPIESSFYLWILHSSKSGCSVEKLCVSGVEVSFEKLALYYRDNILPILRPSQIAFQSCVRISNTL